MQAAMVVTWTRPVTGRENKAVDYGIEVNEYWSRHAKQGKCSEPALFFTEAGNGIWMVTGERDVLMTIHDSEEARMLTLKGELLLEGFCLEFYYAGDAAADYMLRYQSAVASI